MPTDISGVLARLQNIDDFLNAKELMGEVGSYLIDSILERNRRSIDVEGDGFKEYSPAYKELRAKTNRPTRPDLFFDGAMAQAMTYDNKKDEVRLFFMDTVDKYNMSNPAKAYYNHQIRPFFEISAQEKVEILGMVEEALKKAVRKKK